MIAHFYETFQYSRTARIIEQTWRATLDKMKWNTKDVDPLDLEELEQQLTLDRTYVETIVEYWFETHGNF